MHWGKWLLASLVLSACSAKYPVVAQFEDFNEVFLGTVDHDLSRGTAYIEAKGEKSGLVCRGQSRITHIPTSNIVAGAFMIPYCTGQRGTADLRCDDGRFIQSNWTADTCSSGSGYGFDQRGAKFSFVFGVSDEEARQRVAAGLQANKDKPEFPVYVPQETRRKIGYATGTAFLVSEGGRLITNAHVVENAKQVTIVVDGRERAAEVLRLDKQNDLAVLQAEISGLPLRLAPREPRRGDGVFTMGYPMVSIQGQEQKATFGRVNALSGIGDDKIFMQIDVPIQPGNSGGPLLDEDGRVVGVVTATLNQVNVLRQAGTLPQNVNYAVKAGYITMMEKLDAAEEAARSGTKPSVADLVERYTNSVFLVIAR